MLSDTDISNFARDGVICLRNAIDPRWIERMLAIVDEQLAVPGPWTNDDNPGSSTNRMFTGRYLWREKPEIKDCAFNAGFAELAGQIMQVQQIRFYYDHVFVKEPQTTAHTPWHQDLPYWPFQGRQICSIWLALNPASLDEGVPEFIRGSHLSEYMYRPELFNAREDHPEADWTAATTGEPMPDIDAKRDDYDIVSWAVEPGDALIFSARIVHGSQGNHSQYQRRAAFITRWLGDDAIWDPREGADPTVTAEDVSVPRGSPPDDDDRFPIVWQR
ncbi:MAG: phytanoyl-CoA dioxygenase family protein [Pseudomonadota bacterium]